MEYQSVYITASNLEEAKRIGRELVKMRLVACVNIHEKVHSIYEWKGELHEEEESVLIAKTRSERVSPLIEKVKEMHSYDCPCVVSWRIEGGHRDYMDWISEQTNQERV